MLRFQKGYLLGDIDFAKIDAQMNQLGQMGWELVTTTDTNRNQGSTDELLLFFKRPIE